MNPKRFRVIFIILLVIVTVVVIGANFLWPFALQPQWSLTQVARAAKDGRIARIDVTGNDNMRVTLDDGSVVYSTKDPSSSAIEQLATLGVSSDELTAIVWNTDTDWNAVSVACAYLLPLVAVFGAFVWLLRRAVRIQPAARPPDTSEKGGSQDDKENR